MIKINGKNYPQSFAFVMDGAGTDFSAKIDINTQHDVVDLRRGETYKVDVNGTEHECTLLDYSFKNPGCWLSFGTNEIQSEATADDVQP